VRTRRSVAVAIRRTLRGLIIVYALLVLVIVGRLVPKKSSFYYKFDLANNIVLAMSAFACLVLIVIVYASSRNVVRVLPSWRKEGRRLSAQTRRELLIAIASAVVIGVLGFWAGFLAK
jgi:cytochrome bd-type quinol oxidase subunit 2